MTKAEELKILEAIDGLILEAGPDSYIGMTFAGIVEVCRKNIENDFGDSPVQDWEEMRNMLCAERVAHDETKRQLADAQKMCKAAMDENDRFRKMIEELREQRDCMAECVDGNNAIIDEAEAEIRKLKAEIIRMRMERMTDDEMATMYDRMNEED